MSSVSNYHSNAVAAPTAASAPTAPTAFVDDDAVDFPFEETFWGREHC